MDSLKFLIVEDEILIADYIADILKKQSFKNISFAGSVAEAQQKMTQDQPDIIFMDINIEGNYEGIELSKQRNSTAVVIFVTGQTDTKMIEEALCTAPESYLSKPIREVELLTAVRIAVNKRNNAYIIVKDGYNEIRLKLDDIIYIEADKNYLDITCINSKLSVRYTLKDFIKELPISFKQIHRSIIINTIFLEKMSSDEVVVKGHKVPLSRNYRHNL